MEKKRRFGIVSYNMYCNFTNYGSALQTYALHRKVNEIAPNQIEAIVVDYCPDILADKDILNPIKNMWDADEESVKMCELSMPAIRINNEKFNVFYKKYYSISEKKYTSENFEMSLVNENLDGYICGSDTIWCTLEFKGFEDGYFGNYDVMKNSRTISYAASFGDAVFENEDLDTLKSRLKNFKAISVRESTNLELIKENVDVLVQRVLDPTLLFTKKEYEVITEKRLIDEPYILLYARRYNKAMEEYADKLAKEMNCKVVEISLRATNADRHIMFYEAGVEEFLSLVKNAEYVVTNSFHGVIFSAIMNTQFSVFSREQADTKIDELLDSLNLSERKMITGKEKIDSGIDFLKVDEILENKRKESINYLIKALEIVEE